MGSGNTRRNNNLRAGVFVVLSVIAGIAVAVFLSGSLASFVRSERDYVVQFPTTTGVKNLRPGGDVRLGGVSVGRVTGVQLKDIAAADGGERGIVVEVRFNVDDQYPLRTDAQVAIGNALVGAEVWIDIASTGTGQIASADDVLMPGGTTGLAQLLGSETAGRVDNVLAQVERITTALNGGGGDGVTTEFEVGAFLTSLDRTAKNVEGISGDVQNAVTTVVRDDWPKWRGEIDDTMRVWLPEFRSNLSGTVADGRVFVGDVNRFWTDREGAFGAIVDDTAETIRSVRTDTVPTLNRSLDRIAPGVDRAIALIDRANASFGSWEGDVSASLGNARLASQQISLLTEELRRSPWKLLYRPELQEYENQLLYEAARGLAFSAESMRVAAASAERLIADAGPQPRNDPELVQRLRDNLLEPIRNYEEAQQQLLEVLEERTGASRGSSER